MAKQASFLKFEGRIEDLSFYKGADGVHYVRAKSGVSKDRIMNDPAFLRTRENTTEFGHVAQCGKFFRRALQDLIFDVKDRTRVPRMVRVLTAVKNQDLISVRGQRKVENGIQTPQGKAVFELFDFNQNAKLDLVLKVSHSLNTTMGTLSIPNFNPEQHVSQPQGTTHVGFQAGHLRFDFSSDAFEMELSNKMDMPIQNTVNPITLTWSNTATGSGRDYYFLKVSFYQEVNGTLYTLHNGAFNALQLIAIE